MTCMKRHRDQGGVLCVCGGGVHCPQLDMSNSDVTEAALKIQGAMRGMLHRQRMLDDADSVDRTAIVAEMDIPDTTDSAQGSHTSVRSGQSQSSARLDQTEEDQQQQASTQQGHAEGPEEQQRA